jgi:hypothetical protein
MLLRPAGGLGSRGLQKSPFLPRLKCLQYLRGVVVSNSAEVMYCGPLSGTFRPLPLGPVAWEARVCLCRAPGSRGPCQGPEWGEWVVIGQNPANARRGCPRDGVVVSGQTQGPMRLFLGW